MPVHFVRYADAENRGKGRREEKAKENQIDNLLLMRHGLEIESSLLILLSPSLIARSLK